ncbi:hypothetical protein HDE_00893 [Halotydeus destructor]|nr:hypothetical protein HDE_00893 [Halotydeus destructor]
MVRPTLSLEEIAETQSVRSKSERSKLNGFTCHDCQAYYKTFPNLTRGEIEDKINICSRHRSKHATPPSPEHFWDVDFPSTPECIKRGYFTCPPLAGSTDDPVKGIEHDAM